MHERGGPLEEFWWVARSGGGVHVLVGTSGGGWPSVSLCLGTMMLLVTGAWTQNTLWMAHKGRPSVNGWTKGLV